MYMLLNEVIIYRSIYYVKLSWSIITIRSRETDKLRHNILDLIADSVCRTDRMVLIHK
jgi:hypothetical protein